MKTRKKADYNTTSHRGPSLFWTSSDKGGKKPVTLATQMSSGKDDSGKEHDHRTAEDDVNDLLGGGEEELTSLPQTNLGPTPAPAAPKAPEPPDEKEQEEEKIEEPQQEILEIHDNESLGDALTRLRASVNCTLNDLSNKTKIPTHKIRALEEGNYRDIPDINIGMDYIRKLCAEYVVSQETYLEKFKKEHEAYYKNTDVSSRRKDDDLEPDDKLPSKPISIPGLLIVSLIIILCLFILGGLAKVFIKSNSVKSTLPLSDFTQVKRIPIKALNVPSGN